MSAFMNLAAGLFLTALIRFMGWPTAMLANMGPMFRRIVSTSGIACA
jgi:hypothetical protein